MAKKKHKKAVEPERKAREYEGEFAIGTLTAVSKGGGAGSDLYAQLRNGDVVRLFIKDREKGTRSSWVKVTKRVHDHTGIRPKDEDEG